MATPISKCVTAKRRAGFLDNITARVDEEKQVKETRREQKEKRRGSSATSSAKVTGKGKKAAAPQVTPNMVPNIIPNNYKVPNMAIYTGTKYD